MYFNYFFTYRVLLEHHSVVFHIKVQYIEVGYLKQQKLMFLIVSKTYQNSIKTKLLQVELNQRIHLVLDKPQNISMTHFVANLPVCPALAQFWVVEVSDLHGQWD